MSYCRFAWRCEDGRPSDVYVYGSEDGLVCCGCRLDDRWEHDDNAGMVAHLLEHRRAGHAVPQHALDELREEAGLGPWWLTAERRIRWRWWRFIRWINICRIIGHHRRISLGKTEADALHWRCNWCGSEWVRCSDVGIVAWWGPAARKVRRP